MLIGTYGWRHPQWVGTYYPEDMPEDWWLSYYSNEFSVVLVPEADILCTDKGEIEAWPDNVEDDFLFFIGFNDLNNWAKTLSLLEPVWPLIGGFALNDQSAEPENFIEIVSGLSEVAPVCAGVRSAQTEGISGQFTIIQETDVELMTGKIGLALNTHITDCNPRKIRTLIENCLSSMSDIPLQALFFGGNDPGIDIAKQAVTIRDLLE